MPQIGPLEILVVMMVALIVFGPEKLPTIARQIGKAASELRRMASEVKDEFEEGFSLDDDKPKRKVDPPAEVDREGIDPALPAAPVGEVTRGDEDPDADPVSDPDRDPIATGPYATGAPTTESPERADDEQAEAGVEVAETETEAEDGADDVDPGDPERP